MANYKTFPITDTEVESTIYKIEYDNSSYDKVEVEETNLVYISDHGFFMSYEGWTVDYDMHNGCGSYQEVDEYDLEDKEVFIDGDRDHRYLTIYIADKNLANEIARRINSKIPDEAPNYALDVMDDMNYDY